MTTLSLGGFTGRLQAITRVGAATGRRFRGKKAAIAALWKKREVIDVVLARLTAEATGLQDKWSRIHTSIATLERDRLATILCRAQLIQLSVARAFAGIETQSVFGLNGCDADIQSAVSLVAKLRLEVRVSAARAAAACIHDATPRPDMGLLPAPPVAHAIQSVRARPSYQSV
jgi:hypothetical protein